MADTTKCGFVAVLGVPNAGKSTLVNALVGAKVSIVSPKVQTTRIRIRGIAVHNNSQIILTDTPGIFKPKRRLDRAMVAAAWDEAGDADISVLVVDSSKNPDEGTLKIIKGLQKNKKPAVLVLNKVDLIPKEKLLELADKYNEASGGSLFSDIFMVSAEKGTFIPDLLDFLASKMPAGTWLFPEDEISDLPVRMLAAEVTREKAFLMLQQEIPYSLTVETDEFTDNDDGSITIRQTVFVERIGQRKIVLGAGGSKIKSIGMSSRRELEKMLDCKVHLFLEVKVAERWAEDSSRYKNMGLDFNAKI